MVYGILIKKSKKQFSPSTKIIMAKHRDAEKYGAYLASRKWWVKRRAVMKRANGICERCGKFKAKAVHHLNYARVYEEKMSDLQAICKGCHEFIHALSDIDPKKLEKLI